MNPRHDRHRDGQRRASTPERIYIALCLLAMIAMLVLALVRPA